MTCTCIYRNYYYFYYYIRSGLKNVITPVLAGLLENDFEKMWAFKRFFEYIEHINRLRVRTTTMTIIRDTMIIIMIPFLCNLS